MSLQDIANQWGWDKISEKALEIAVKLATSGLQKGGEAARDSITKRWKSFKHSHASEDYKAHLLIVIGKTKILGNPKSIEVEQIYTDAYFHDKLNAQRRFPGSLKDLKGLTLESLKQSKRVSAKDVAASRNNLFILGKPGAGKTTFLKYLAVQACRGHDTRTPIFVSLKDWSDSSLTLIEFLEKSFSTCGFPETQDASVFLRALLESGQALVLLDGLDEINEWQSKRAIAIREITNFSNKHVNCQICLTCRLAASDYSFDRFDYVEIADFNRIQQKRFINQWFSCDEVKRKQFLKGWRNSRQRGLREIGRTPLLLALICLAYDETLDFPTRHVDLYKEALEALLKKWDTSRNIRRDDFYKNLPLARKEHLLEDIAARFYLDNAQVFPVEDLNAQVLTFLQKLPDTKEATVDNAASVVTAVAAQHGLLVEIITGVYAYSHLTFQEFFTARYIVSNQKSNKLLENIARKGLLDQKWREVLLFTASLLPSADELFIHLLAALNDIKANNKGVKFMLSVLELPAREQKSALNSVRTGLPLTVAEFRKVVEHIHTMWRFLEGKSRSDYSVLQARVRAAKDLVTKRPQVAAELLGGYSANPEAILSYFYGCRLIIECLEVSMTSKREDIIMEVMS